MSSCYITISYLMFFYFISSADLISILFYSILFHSILLYFKLIWFDLILSTSIEFDLLYFSVLYLISMNDLCLSVRPSVCLFICMNKFMFSLLFFFSFFTLFSWTSSSHTYKHGHTHTDTDTQIHMNICSFLWLVHIALTVCKWRIVFEWSYYIIFDLIW